MINALTGEDVAKAISGLVLRNNCNVVIRLRFPLDTLSVRMKIFNHHVELFCNITTSKNSHVLLGTINLDFGPISQKPRLENIGIPISIEIAYGINLMPSTKVNCDVICLEKVQTLRLFIFSLVYTTVARIVTSAHSSLKL